MELTRDRGVARMVVLRVRKKRVWCGLAGIEWGCMQSLKKRTLNANIFADWLKM